MSSDDLKKKRTAAKSALTRKVNELRRLVVEDKRSEVLKAYDVVKDVFSDFANAHSEYHDSLEDDADIIASDEYFEQAQNNYITGLGGIRDYIKSGSSLSASNVKSQSQSQTSESQAKPMSVVKLPPVPQPDVFSGKSEAYPMWKASFKTLVDKHDIGFDEKLFYLRQYTAGDARSAIESLFLCPSKQSYEAALGILEDRFGNPSMVASSFRRKLESWPKIAERDGKGLQKFSDYLKQICIAKMTYKSLKILDDEFENKKILSKLPLSIVNEWIEIVVDSKVFPDFEEFSDFISNKSKIANHPLLPSERSYPTKVTEQHNTRSQRSHNNAQSISHTGQDAGSQVTCPVCGNNHRVLKCSEFSNMTLSERKQAIRNKNMCFGCLAVGHQSKACRNRHTCAVCSKKHPTLLHDYNVTSAYVTGQNSTSASANMASTNVQNTPVANNSSFDNTSTFLTQQSATSFCGNIRTPNRATTMIVPVVLSHQSSAESVIVYALLDTQSDTHFVSDEVVSILGVTGPTATLDLTTMNGRMRRHSRVIDGLNVQPVTGGSQISLGKCFARDRIPCNRSCIPTTSSLANWPHLSGIELPPYYERAPIGLLIGFHCSAAMKPLETCTGADHEPFGWRTVLGWCILGTVDAGSCDVDDDEFGTSHTIHGCISLRTECRELVIDVDESTYSDVMPGMNHKYSSDDVRFMKIMSNEMFQRPDKHYEAPLPIKDESKFPSNRSLAEKRLESLRRKFSRDSEYKDRYVSVMAEMLDLGFAEVVPSNETTGNGRTWYIPHHGVLQGKLRVVFDCSATFHGVSLNERLLQGPDLSNSLLGILLRFRLEKVALTCDIQKMYHQFIVSEKDRDLLRFLWWPNGDFTADPVDHRMRVHLFGAKSSPAVATYGLRKTATDHEQKHSPEASHFVKCNFYVDDGVTAVTSALSCGNLIKETQELLAEGGLKCHKVMSNFEEVLQQVPEEDRAPMTENKLHKTLGVLWNVENDNFLYQLYTDHNKTTRRGLLSCLQKFFDPFGIISPLILPAKVLLQAMCFQGYDWDQHIAGSLTKSYDQWCEHMNQIGEVSVPRWVPSDQLTGSIEIHHFADASSVGYAACSYLRWIDEKGICHVTFLMGKCRVVPLKPVLSIPRLELIAAVLCVQIARKLKLELSLQCSHFFWTDSTIVLGYIKNEATRFKVFVANRVQRIHNDSRPEEWFHIRSSENPADDGSRGIWSERWLNGPSFLSDPGFQTPVCESFITPVDDPEVKCLSCSVKDSSFDVRSWKGWFSTLKVWAWTLRFINRCRGQSVSGDLSLDEIERAKVTLLYLVQRFAFPDELQDLHKHQSISRQSRLYRLDIFLGEDGLIHVGGRIRHASLSMQLRHPIVLPGDHDLSYSIVQFYHQRVHHQGRGITCAEIRSHGFWILGLQKLVKRLIHSCVICSRLRGKPCEQKMSDLPVDRLTPGPPFVFCGSDLFGPFLVKCGRKELKRYGVMFTCLVSRAIHLEVVHSLTSDSFVNSFRRFIAIRGPVRELRCDQGTNFVGAKGDLLKMGCEISFNPPASSHRGGVWERMIGVARRVIEGILLEHGSRLDDEGLMTILAETTSIVNSRPLSVENSADPNSLEPLTPNHLLTMKSKVIHKPSISPESVRADLYAQRQWKRVQFLSDLFWSRWKREIVQLSMSRSKWNRYRRNLRLDDIVLLVDEHTHRSSWKMARVIEVFNSADGLVRSVHVKLSDGSILHRPVQKLVHIMSTD